LVGSVVAFAVGVLFSFSALFVPLYLVLLVLLVLDRRPPLRTWIPYGIVVVAAVVAYVAWVHADLRLSGPVDVARYVVDAWAVVFVPAFVGFSTPLGHLPLRWVVAAVAFQAALAALVVATRAHWRAWAFLVVAVLANLVFVGLTRVNGASPELIAHGFRYLADVNFLFPLALGLACREVTVRWPPLPAAALGVVLGLTFVGNGVVSGPTAWFGPSAARYAARLRAGVEEVRRTGGAVLDGQVPEYVVPAAFGPYNRLSEVVPLFDRHVTVGRRAGAVWQVEATGQVEPVTLVSRTGGRAVDLQRAKRLFVVRSAATSSVQGDLCVRSGADAAVLAWALQPALPSADWHLTVESTTPISTGGAVFVYRGGAWTAAHDPYLALGAGTQVSTVDLGGPQLEDLLIELPARKTVCIGALNIDQLIPRSVPSHAHA
jgi:hypothetical protein